MQTYPAYPPLHPPKPEYDPKTSEQSIATAPVPEAERMGSPIQGYKSQDNGQWSKNIRSSSFSTFVPREREHHPAGPACSWREKMLPNLLGTPANPPARGHK